MTPLQYYYNQIEEHQFIHDEQQLVLATRLDTLHHALTQAYQQNKSWFSFLNQPALVKGMYLWGGVGIGKTFLMDCLYQTLPFKEKKRMHFHHFMRWIHIELKKLQGKKNPLEYIAKTLRQETQLLCFDELHVTDIVDAMILGQLFNALFAQGICLITTSNTHPDDLYKHGLQRKQFLPAITLLKKNTEVIHISTNTDYRLRHLDKAAVFFDSHDAQTENEMNDIFSQLAHKKSIVSDPLEIHGRYVPVKKRSQGIIWLEFDALCKPPRSHHDYLILSETCHTIMVSNIPIIAPNAKDIISLFIRLIDILYDAHTRFIFSAAAPAPQLYQSGTLITDYQRAASRLIEMQSVQYYEKK